MNLRERLNVNQNAPVISRQEIVIKAPLESVWKIHTDISNWTKWNPDITSSELAGPIAAGTTFHWETAGMKISSTIREAVPFSKIGWSGEAGGILAIHIWTFSKNSEGTLVHTEESWEGSALPLEVGDMKKALDASLISWLSYLKRRAEKND